MNEDLVSGGIYSDLLNQFENILEFDPLIDEVGFIHPSQFATLNTEAGSSLTTSDSGSLQCIDITNQENASFWVRDHKLGISAHVLLPLYKAAKYAFMRSLVQHQVLEKPSETSGDKSSSLQFSFSCNTIESKIMKHSRALILLSCDFGTAWNSRKLIVSKQKHMSTFIDELLLSGLVLSYSPKSEQAWCHRRWVIKMIAQKCSALEEIVRKESELVEKIAERSKMNYRAWNHRCWLVSYMTREQVLHELMKSRKWAGLHVADGSCFHFRTRLLQRILADSCHELEDEVSDVRLEIDKIWQEELDWNETLIKRYVGREALWLHRRFLSLCWIRLLGTGPGLSPHKSSIAANIISTFLDNELCLVNSSSTIPDNDYEDFQAQALHSTTYILWLTKQVPKSQRIKLGEKLRAGSLKAVLNVACPERRSIWDELIGYWEASDQDLEETA